MLQKHSKKVVLVVLFFVTIKFSTQCIFKNRICLLASCSQGCDLKNRLTIGKFSKINTSNNSREMDAKKLLIMNFQIRVGLGPGELWLKFIAYL